jgi:hypothetical protein
VRAWKPTVTLHERQTCRNTSRSLGPQGKILEQQHYTGALAVIEVLDQEPLAALALTVAAGAVATRSEEANDGDVWNRWWRGVDSDGDPDADALDAAPGIMWRTLRPQDS